MFHRHRYQVPPNPVKLRLECVKQSKSVNKEAYLAEQVRLKQEAEQNGTIQKYVKATNSPIEE